MELMNNAIYYLIVSVMTIIGLVVIISLIVWIVGEQTGNIELKRKASLFLVISLLIFYFIRFGSITLISIFAGEVGDGTNTVVSLLQLLQVLILACVPPFVIQQAYIFQYQYLLTDRVESKQKRNSYIIYGIGFTVLVIVILQLLIGLF
ncbi:TPA: hypothetical protein TZW92_001796 [Streptococcus suis]|nr:hypothetical protein [Streptococcus suis]